MLLLTACLTSCASKVVVIPANKTVEKIHAGKSFRSEFSGWFVPDARMKEIMDALNERANANE